MPESNTFSAGPGTIAIVIIFIIVLVIIVVLLSAFLLWFFKKRGKYSVAERPPGDGIELGGTVRYTSSQGVRESTLTKEVKKDSKDKAALGIANTGFSEEGGDLYTEMGPEEMSPGEMKKSEGETGSQDLLYTDMTPGPIEEQEKDTTPTPAALPQRPPKPGEKPKEEKPKEEKPPKPDPYKVPVKKEEMSNTTEKPPLQCPPTPEMYTDMRGGIQEVYFQPDTGGPSQDLYDDVQPSIPQSPNKEEDKAPLLTTPPAPDDTYEDTDTAIASAEQYRISTSSLPRGFSSNDPLPPLPPREAGGEKPPALPQRPVLKKRSSSQTPLPPTPLQKSLGSSSGLQSPASPTAPTAVVTPIEECLYEPIPARDGQQLLAESSSQPASKAGKGSKQKAKKGKK